MRLILLLILFLASNAYGQGCCGVGGSLVSGGHPVLDHGSFMVNPSGNYSEASHPERNRGNIGVLLAYGITNRLSLSVKTAYVWAWSSIYQSPIIVNNKELVPGKTNHYSNHDWGDASATLQYALIRLTPINKQELVARIDAGIPWGPDQKKSVGLVELPGNVQTGSGGFSLTGSLSYLLAFPQNYVSISSTITGAKTFETRRGKNPGDEFSFSLTSLFGPFHETRGSITFSYNAIGMTYNEQNKPETGTPGKRISVAPALEYSILPNLKALFFTEIPLWRDTNQSLFGNNKAFKAEIFWFIRHKQTDSHRIETINF